MRPLACYAGAGAGCELRSEGPRRSGCRMGGGRRKGGSSSVATPANPTIHEATLGNAGAVIKGAKITQAEAEGRRKAGLDVVVCGPTLGPNSALARMIEE